MKREDHTAQLWIALILQVFVLLFMPPIHRHSYPISEYLLADLFLPLSLLPVIAALRRGAIAAKACSLPLSILPAYYAFASVCTKGPMFIHEVQRL